MVDNRLLLGAVLLRLNGWLREQPFASGCWPFPSGITALAPWPLKFVERGVPRTYHVLAALWSEFANLFVSGCLVGSVILMVKNRYMPPRMVETLVS